MYYHHARYIAIAMVVMLSSAMPATGENGIKEQPEPSEQNRQLEEGTDGKRKREIACSCCKECMAARKEVRGQEEGPPAKNGCRDCCRRCPLPDPRKMPPEIVK